MAAEPARDDKIQEFWLAAGIALSAQAKRLEYLIRKK
jgi:hypothetical protein